jgi:riboflavin kinase/FMN adenylyltransferase
MLFARSDEEKASSLRVVDGFWERVGFARGTVVTFGKFDALHRGHQAIFARVCETAAQSDRDAVVVFFHPNPLQLLAPDRCPPPLTTVPQKLRLMDAFGFDAAVVARFDDRMRTTKAETFIECLVRNLGMERVVVGRDARFGYRAQGDVTMLCALGERFGYRVETVDANRLDDEVISSRRVREAIQVGHLGVAERLLGRRYAVEGVVVRGDQRGRTLGFPTANVDTGDQLLPPFGIYVAEARVGDTTYGAAVSLGVRPTFNGTRPVLETHVLDFDGDLYDETIEIAFVEKIREEMRFESVDALLARMREDVFHTRRTLGR